MRLGQRWVHLFVVTRVAATLTAALLLTVHRVTDYDPLLLAVVLAWGAATAVAAWTRPRIFGRRMAWVADTGVALALVLASQEWRSPFYLLFLTTLAAPAAALPLRRALTWGAGTTLAYAAVAVLTGVDWGELGNSARLDTLVTHLLLPLVATGGVAYTADALRRLAREQRRAERLAVETERRRIAWELHDSAKQRLHAAALLLSAAPDSDGPLLGAALQELRGATADMETSIAELRSPLEGRRLDHALRERAAELQPLTEASITVEGTAPRLPAVMATHVYRIVAEAMTNAVRHSGARTVDVQLTRNGDSLLASVRDDGTGLPESTRPGATGMLTMRSRAFAIGARLTVGRGPGDRGTRVDLDVPLDQGATA